MLNFFKTKTDKSTQTFTYFIPSPPPRKTGYREREFDQLTQTISLQGGEILDIKLSSFEQGLWAIIFYECSPQQFQKINDSLEKSLDSLFTQQSEQIDGLYYDD